MNNKKNIQTSDNLARNNTPLQVQIDDKRSFEDWGAWTNGHWVLSSPRVKTKFLDLPARDGALDLTEVLAGEPRFDNRTLSWSLIFPFALKDSWDDIRGEILNFCHGRRKRIFLPGKDDRYLMGRIECGNLTFSHNATVATLPMTAICDPHFNLDFDKTFTFNDTYTTTIYGGARTVTPEIVTNQAVEITINSVTVFIPEAGTWRLPELVLVSGANEVVMRNMQDVGILSDENFDKEIDVGYPALGVMNPDPQVPNPASITNQRLRIEMSVGIKEAQVGAQPLVSVGGAEFSRSLIQYTNTTASPNRIGVRLSSSIANAATSANAFALQSSIMMTASRNVTVFEGVTAGASTPRGTVDGSNISSTSNLRFGVIAAFSSLDPTAVTQVRNAFWKLFGRPSTDLALTRGVAFINNFKLYDHGNLVRDMVAVRRGDVRFIGLAPQNGFWCKVSNRYYYNVTESGEFGLHIPNDATVTFRFQEGSL